MSGDLLDNANPERLAQILEELGSLRASRMNTMPDKESFDEIIADAINALEVLYIVYKLRPSPETNIPQTPVFRPYSKPENDI